MPISIYFILIITTISEKLIISEKLKPSIITNPYVTQINSQDMTIFLIQERVFFSKLRLEMEPTDFILKHLISDCMKQHDVPNNQILFSCLAQYGSKFWDKSDKAMIIIMQWMHHISQQLSQIPIVENVLKMKIWKNFLCRLSLDSWLILGSSQSKSNGNRVLEIILDVIQDTIYSQFSLQPIENKTREREYYPSSYPVKKEPDTISIASDRNIDDVFNYNETRIGHDEPESKNILSRLRLSNYGSSPMFGKTNSANSNQRMLSRPEMALSENYRGTTIPEVNENEVSDEEFETLKKSTRNIYLPKSDSRGLPVKLTKLRKKESTSNKSRSRKKINRKKTKSKDRDEDKDEDKDEDEEDDSEDDSEKDDKE